MLYRYVIIMCCAIVFVLLVRICLPNLSDTYQLAQKMGVDSSWHTIDKKIKETLVSGMIQKDAFDFAKSIDAEIIPISGCYIVRFFEYKHDLDRYICFKQGRLDTILYLSELELY